MRVRREWEEWVTRGVRKGPEGGNLDAGNGGMGNGGRGEGACKKDLQVIFTRKRKGQQQEGPDGLDGECYTWRPGGAEAWKRKAERAQKSRPSNLGQSKDARKCLTCQGAPGWLQCLHFWE